MLEITTEKKKGIRLKKSFCLKAKTFQKRLDNKSNVWYYNYRKRGNNFMTDEYFILTLQLALENEQLKRKITQLEIEVESLEKELRKPERMTSSENRAYWGIFG